MVLLRLLLEQIERKIVNSIIERLARERFAQVCDGWIIGIEYQGGSCGQQADRVLPICDDAIDFTVAVQLVTEQVGKDDDTRGDGLHNLGQCGLVGFQDRDGAPGAPQAAIW